MAATPQWHTARCTLCDGSVLARDDRQSAICPSCGALLDILPSPSGTTVRHVGQALDAVRDSLEPVAMERALDRLRERASSHALAAQDALRSARVRRLLTFGALVVALVSLVGVIWGDGGRAALLAMMAAFVVIGSTGFRRGSLDSEQRARERQAERQSRAFQQEIARREIVLSEQRLTLRRG
jgi:hypothetical protein